MKVIIVAAALAAAAGTASAQTVIKERDAGVHSAPTAGATPQARARPAPDTTVLEEREKTTVIEPRTRVIQGGSTSVEIETRERR